MGALIVNIWDVILLGAVQGLTEFLPISSSGHLILLHHLLGNSIDNLSFDVALHLGTLLSLSSFYWYEWRIIGFKKVSLNKNSPYRRLFILVVVASIPTAIIGLTFRHAVEELSAGSRWLAAGFLLNAILLFMAQASDRLRRSHSDITTVHGFWIGMAQGAAIIPALSRSCSTISMALLLGVDRSKAVLFSFLISIPAIAGACFLEIPKINWHTVSLKLV